jgi:Zinc carboxypeptidase
MVKPAAGLKVRTTAVVAVSCVVAALVAMPRAQSRSAPRVTTPKEQFGKNIGDDYFLVNWTQWVEYLKKLDRESDRMTVVEIGKTAEGRAQYTAIVTSPDNHKRLAQYKEMNRRLALADGISDEQAHQLARDGKIVVWIDGGLHASEVLGAAQLVELTYRLTSATDPETLRILNDAIVLLTNVNPDGMELVSNWYMRESEPTRRSSNGLPRLYQKYIGHDNNRDFYMMNQPESENANRLMYREWYPAIMYNHHQTGPAGAVLFAPPFRDPFNYHFDPLIPLGIDLVGAAIHTRLAVEGKPGAVMRSAASYSTWFNGGIRTTSYFHNQIGILTEMIGNPTPIEIPFVPEMQLRRADVPYPIAPQPWHFRQSIEYSMTTNYAILDIASERKEDFLFNMYRMAKNAIEMGGRDHWTVYPKRLEQLRTAIAKQSGGSGRGGVPVSFYDEVLHDPAARDPRGFIIPSDQADLATATKFVNILIKAGVVVQRASAAFTAGGKSYPAGSYVVKTAQPFRAHVMDMFEPQDHPNDIPYPGGPPRPPYDVTGYNLSYSMGISFDRILDGFDGPFERVPDVIASAPASFTAAPQGGSYLINAQINDAFVAVNRLLKAGQPVFRAGTRIQTDGRSLPAGTFVIPALDETRTILEKTSHDKGITVEALPSSVVPVTPLRPVRVGLWDVYGGSMPSGWTRWLLEQFEFPFEVVFQKTLDEGNLAAKFDVLIFVDGAIPMSDGTGGGQPRPETIPAEFRDRLGTVSVSRTVPELRKFVEAGGRLLAIGSSTAIGYHLGLPMRNALVERGAAGDSPLPSERFFIPGSILEARVDTSHPLAFGIPDPVNVFFDDSPAFRLLPEAASRGVVPVAWFGSASPLKSGWAWGQQYLDQAVQIVDARVGKGRVLLFGSEVAWRAQPHGTFKFLFNGIYLQ